MKSPTDAVVLVVEDNRDNLFIVTELLRAKLKVKHVSGYTSGREFFQFLIENSTIQPDLILLDLQLPQEDGYTLLRKIRAHPQLQEACVLAVTANIMADDVKRVQAAEFDGFIGKPIDRSRFSLQIQRALAGEAVWDPR
jgi:CheY-like chemotaxis protein